MLELGQPNHPYDLAKVPGGGLRVRRARPGESMVTLDGVERTFTGDDLLICDGDGRPVGIAGVMGGADTEIDASTTDVLLEMAWFLPIGIAKTSRRLRLRSEASARFEKGTDPEVIDLAHRRFAELVGVLRCPARGRHRRRAGRAARAPAGPGAHRPGQPPARHGARRGRDREAAGADRLRGRRCGGDDTDVTIPSWRYDSSSEIDVVEEVARHYGYAAIGTRLPPSPHAGRLTERPARAPAPAIAARRARRCPRRCRCRSSPPATSSAAGWPGDGIEIANPLVAEESVLRTSLLPGLVKALATNAARRNTGVGLFEIGHVFRRPDTDGEIGPLPDEREMLGVALGGRDAAEAVHEWRALAELLSAARRRAAQRGGRRPAPHPLGAPGRSVAATWSVRSARSTRSCSTPTASPSAWAGSRSTSTWSPACPTTPHIYRPVSRYPSSDIDLAFDVDDAVPAGAVEQALRAAGGDRWRRCACSTCTAARAIAPGRRSLAYRLRLDAPDHTLTDDEVAEVRRRCIDAVESAFPATLRG